MAVSVLPSPVASSAQGPLEHDHAGRELDVEGPHAEDPPDGDRAEAEPLGDELPAHVPGPGPAAELVGPRLQLVRRELAEQLLEVADAGDEQSGPGQPAGGRPADLGDDLVAGHRPEPAGVRQVRRAGVF